MSAPVYNFADYVSPVFDEVIEDMMGFRHDQYLLGGGRGSFKSTTTSVRGYMGIMDDPTLTWWFSARSRTQSPGRFSRAT